MTLTTKLAAFLALAAATAAGAQTTASTPESVRQQPAPHEAAPLVHPIVTLKKKSAATPATDAPAQPATKSTVSPATAKPVVQKSSGAPAATPVPPAPKTILKPAPEPVKPATPSPAAATPAAVPSGPSFGPLNRTTIVLDASHGGPDSGSRISDALLEKDITLTFAFKLRSLLQARGFNVVLTRDADSLTSDNNPTPLTLDDRAGIANHARAVACLLLHATSAGAGVHLYYSELPPAPGETANLPWLTAQGAWVSQSVALSQKLSQAVTHAGLSLVASAASVRPVDSLTCPALVVELAPKSAGDTGTLNDSSYQSSAAEALVGALVFWRNQMQPPQRLTDSSTETAVHP